MMKRLLGSEYLTALGGKAHRLLLMFTVILSANSITRVASAQAHYDGCYDFRGIPVISILNNSIPDVAIAREVNGLPVIFYSTQVLSQMSDPDERLFIYLHECGHHALAHLARGNRDMELEADCYGAKMLQSIKHLTGSELQEVAHQVGLHSPGDMTHLGGADREHLVEYCAAQVPNLVLNPGLRHHPPNNVPDDADSEGKPTEELIASFQDDAEARACIARVRSVDDVVWHKDQDLPLVEVHLKYKNSCERPVECFVAVGTGQKFSDDYVPYRAFKAGLSLKPGDSDSVNGKLRWKRDTQADTPHLDWPLNTSSQFMHCQYSDHLTISDQVSDVEEGDEFETAVRRMMNASFGNFNAVIGPKDEYDDVLSLIKIPYAGKYRTCEIDVTGRVAKCRYLLDTATSESDASDMFETAKQKMIGAAKKWTDNKILATPPSLQDAVSLWEVAGRPDGEQIRSFPRVYLSLNKNPHGSVWGLWLEFYNQ